MRAITREKSDELGFVIACLFKQAISLQELRLWCYEIIRENETFPDYIFELANFDASKAKIYNIIGFYPSWPCSEESKAALYGIAFERGFNVYDCPISKEIVISLLDKNYDILDLFYSTFPFIDYRHCSVPVRD